MTELTNDTIALFTKRAYDMAGCTNKKVRVQVNGKRLDIKDFTSYVNLYLKNEEGQENPTVTQAPSDRWEVICTLSNGVFRQVSFVNSICTSKGGTHVDYIVQQICHAVIEKINKGKKKALTIKPF